MMDEFGQSLSEAIQIEDARRRRYLEAVARLGIVNAADLDAREFPPPRWALPGYVTGGLSLLAGKPKLGKSWWALGAAHAIAGGRLALGKIEVEAGPCLFVGLEDTKPRLQRRMRAIRQGEPPSLDLHLATAWRRLDEGGIEDLALWLEIHPDARLVCFDTWAKVRGNAKADDIYRADYGSVAELKALADKHGVAILLVHHLRKAMADDPLDEVSGSTGLTGAVDTVLVLRRDRGQADAVLHVTGRDVEEVESALQFDKATGIWTLLGDAEEFRRSKEQNAIIRAIIDAGGALTPSQIAKATGKNPSTVRSLLQKLFDAGAIHKLDDGRYEVLEPN